MAEFRMPSLGADMTDGTVTRWLVGPGSTVSKGDIVAEIETDKADMEVEVFESGTIERIVVPEGDRAPVGAVLAIIAAPVGAAEPATPSAIEPQLAPDVSAPAMVQPAPITTSSPAVRATPTAKVLAGRLGIDLTKVRGTGVDGAITRADIEQEAAGGRPATRPARRLLVSPYARRLAREMGVDISSVRATGAQGAVTAADVRRTVVSPGSTEPSAVPSVPRSASRRAPLISLMERSNREIPHYYLDLDIDLSRALRWLETENQRRPVTQRVLYSSLLVKAVAIAAHDVPEVNGYWRDGELAVSHEVNVGVAISLRGGGVVAPAITDAAGKTLTTIMAEMRDLVARSRSGRLRPSELTSGTITVTNLGELGADVVHGVIYPPQVALVGFGRVRERPWAESGMLAVRPIVTATLAGDHRASDGHRGGNFLAAINRLLQEPEQL